MIFFSNKRRQGIELFTSTIPEPEQRLIKRKYKIRMIFSDVFFVLFLICCVIAITNPSWGERYVIDYSRGVDLVFAFDISRSMTVRDCPPLPGRQGLSSRLERTLFTAHDIGLKLEGIRLGAAIGKGQGVLALPLSYSTEALLNFISGTNEFSLTGGGTNLESLIDAAFTAFQDNMPAKRGIVLFSDGEALSGAFEAAVSRALERGIIICTVAVGTEEGGPVLLEDGTVMMNQGTPVISSKQNDTLQFAAERTGGIHTDGNRFDAASQISGFWNSLSADTNILGRRIEIKNQSHFFVLIALIFLCFSKLAGFKLKNNIRQAKLVCMVFFTGIFPFLFFSCSNIEGKISIMEGNYNYNKGFYTEAVSAYLKALSFPDSVPYAEYGLGLSFFSLEENDAALDRYMEAMEILDKLPRDRHKELRFRLNYNKGIIFFEKGDYQNAFNAFRSALEIDGNRIAAKKNLELSLISLSLEQQGASMPDGNQDTFNEDSQESEGVRILFDYLRSLEQEQWRNRSWRDDNEYTGLDY